MQIWLVSKKHYIWQKKLEINYKSCQSNSDKRASDFGSFLVIQLLLYLKSRHWTSSKYWSDFIIKIEKISRGSHKNKEATSKMISINWKSDLYRIHHMFSPICFTNFFNTLFEQLKKENKLFTTGPNRLFFLRLSFGLNLDEKTQ